MSGLHWGVVGGLPGNKANFYLLYQKMKKKRGAMVDPEGCLLNKPAE